MGHLNMSYPCRIYMSLHRELEFQVYYDRLVVYQVTKSDCGSKTIKKKQEGSAYMRVMRQTSGIIISDSFKKMNIVRLCAKKKMKKYKKY